MVIRRGSVIRRGLKWAVGLLAALLASVAVLLGAIETGHFRDPLIRYIAARAGRQFTRTADSRCPR